MSSSTPPPPRRRIVRPASSASTSDGPEPGDARAALGSLREEVAKVVVGQDSTVTGLVTALLVRGHVLLEGVPGVAKTLLVKTLGQALDVDVARIQCTPDLLPADITGQPVLDRTGQSTTFREGPVFTNLLLADELNRTPPKTQSALLEAMEERQVSVEGRPRRLPDPFLVIATQNPIEHEGTYPLPEAQLDRFLLKLTVGYPSEQEEDAILERHDAGLDPHDLSHVQSVAGPEDLAAGRAAVDAVEVDPAVRGYVLALARATREAPSVQLGVSPRGATMLLHAAKAWAWLAGRPYLSPDEVKAVARPALRHRLLLRPEAALEGATPEGVLERVLAAVPVPRVSSAGWAAGDTDVPVAAPVPRPFSRTWWAGWLPRPTVVTAALLGGVVVATPFITRPLGALLAAAVVLVALVDAYIAPSPWSVGVTRRPPAVLVLGAEAELSWHLGSPSGRILRVWLADALQPSLGAASRRFRLGIPAHGRATVRTTVRPWRRGTFQLGEMVVRVAGPLGLATRQAPRTLPGTIQVHPAFPSRNATLLRLELDRLRNAGNRIAPTLGGGTEFDHLREYRHGDDVRRVDWSATVRLGYPIVRTYRVERDRTVQVLLEHGRAAATVVDGVPRLDHGMDAAMALLTAAAEVGDRAGLVTYAHRITGQLAAARRGDQVARAAAMLHALEPELVEAAHRTAFAHVAARQRRRALLVVLTDIGAAAAIDALAHALPVLTSRHEVVVGSVVDEELERMADRAPQHALAAHNAAGAATVLARRARNADRLVARGAQVVTGPPQVVAERLVDRYLDLKARGRL